MKTILHVSDPHFGTVKDEVRQALLNLALDQMPEHILITGDITQRARRKQFAEARLFIAKLPAPVMVVPGNHDIPLFNLVARWLKPYANYCATFGPSLEPEYESDSLLVVGVNTSRPYRHVDGEISPEQVERVARRLRQARPEQLRIVMQHHPVTAIEESDVKNLVVGREQAVPAWVDAGMDILLAGHIHLPYVKAIYGTGERSAWTAQAGTALSWRTRDGIPNSVNIIRHQAGICLFERWDFEAASGQFMLSEESDLALDH
ncbi:metallophosphoesterase [Parahaliea sp. F7430]|uniref:Metallophosphoesterase n=1 Tax=Sediminihaliea albiluteola TaxID=2758564 RepID=A0A7W2YK39_9GAMM|nr:metallophosphoesterase [Sediminihaliea albiluteola]MBA6414216.1 metallophosphoesterase [Sediminihaliea albiluteola]